MINAMDRVPHRPAWTLADLNAPLPALISVSLVALVCYQADRLVYVLGIPPDHIASFWPATAFLVAVLLLVPRGIWPVIIAAGLGAMALADLKNGVPIRFEIWITIGNLAEALVATFGISFLSNGVPKLINGKALARYLTFAVIFVPFGSAIVGANGSAPGGYALQWRLWFFADALAFLTVTPAMLAWVREGREWSRKPQNYLEFSALMTLLVLFGYLAFMGTRRGEQPALLYSLVPLLLWAALRLGLKGVSTSMVVVALLSIWGASHGRGPFAEQGPLNSALSLQLFLFFAAIPFTILAVVVEEQKRTQGVVRDSEERFRMAAEAGKMFAYEWEVATDKILRSEGVAHVLGADAGAHTSGQQILATIPPDDRERLIAAVANLTPREPSLRICYRMVRSDGNVIWVERNSHAHFDNKGRMVRMVGMVADITERVHAEEALRASQEQFQAIWNNSPAIMFIKDRLGRYLDVNPLFMGQTSLPREQVLGKTDEEIFPPEQAAAYRASDRQILEENRPMKCEETEEREGGGRTHIVQKFPLRDAKGQPYAISGIITDISDRKLSEQALRQKEAELSEAQRLAQVGSWEWDPIADKVTWSRELYRIVGRDPNLPAATYPEHATILTAESWERLQRSVEDALHSGTPYELEMEYVRPDGSTIWGRARGEVLRDDTGRIVRLRGTVQDITQRKLVDQALRESEDRLRLAAQVGKMYAIDWDVATDLVIRSDKATQILGLTGEQVNLTLQQMLVNIHPEDRVAFISSIAGFTPENPNSQICFRLVRPDGSLVWLERSGHAFFDKKGRMVRVVGMVADITERKLAEEALSRVGGRLIEAHEEERSRIARELHDDIGQRLALLINDLHGLVNELPETALGARNRLHEQVKRVHKIAADTQAMSHQLHSSKLQFLGIVAAARSFCQELSEQHNVVIDVTHAGIPPAVPSEISLCLFRVMQEALQNAVKHSGMQHFEVELRGQPDGICLTVRDAGLGFDLETARTNRGLGLISMLERVHLVNGTFSIESAPNLGTTINVRVPLNQESRSVSAGGNESRS